MNKKVVAGALFFSFLLLSGTLLSVSFVKADSSEYIEQDPPAQSEWDTPYETNLCAIENVKWWHSGEWSGYPDYSLYISRAMFDRDPDSYFQINSSKPFQIHFYAHEETEFAFLRFYYKNLTGSAMDSCISKYAIYADDVFQEEGNYTASVNGQWVTWDFEDFNATTVKLQINATKDGVASSITQINELELFTTEKPPHTNITQEDVSYFEEIPRWWNGLDWSFSLHIDDVTTISTLPSAWQELLPCTPEMQGALSSSEVPSTNVDNYHVEYGSHSISHGCSYWNDTYADAKSLAITHISEVESASSKTSLWGDTCISYAYPCTKGNWQYATGCFDAGFRITGQLGREVGEDQSGVTGRAYRLRDGFTNHNYSNYNTSLPASKYTFLGMHREGSKPQTGSTWTTDELIDVRENNSFADMMLHDNENMISTFPDFVEEDTTGWWATWGEVVSYWWWKEYSNVTYDSISSTSSKLVFKTHHLSELLDDGHIWDVPVTLAFNLTGNNSWDGGITVKWTDNESVYKNSDWRNLSGFSTGSGHRTTSDPHHNQTMQEGYRVDGDMLYVSSILGDNMTIELSGTFDVAETEVSDLNITAINNQANNTEITPRYRTFNWTKVADAGTYSIRVGNSTDAGGNVTDVFFQLDNITVNSANCTNTYLNTSNSASPYEYNYYENSTHCFFYVPYSYNISYTGDHHYQVRAYRKV